MMNSLGWFTVLKLLQRAVRDGREALELWWRLDERMPEVNRAFNKVRGELYQVGLLADQEYLDQIELGVVPLPSRGESGYVYECVSWIPRLLGFEEGVIYLPSDLPSDAGSDLRGARKTKGMLALDKKTRIQAGCRGIAIGENGVLPSQQEVRIKQPLAKEGHHNVVCYSIGPVADNLGSL